MRSESRIAEIQALIESIWRASPDLRYMQLIYLLQRSYTQQHGKNGIVEAEDSDGFPKVGFDLFNVEDENLIRFLKQVAKSGM